jgi:hypothetical protein
VAKKTLDLHLMPPAAKKAVLTANAPPQAAAQVASLSDSQTSALANAVDSIGSAMASPGDAKSAQALAAAADANPTAFHIAARMLATGLGAKWESESDSLNPVGGIKRRKPFPVKLLPATVTPSSNAGQLTWTPQEEFEGFRLCVPSGQPCLPGYATQLQAGDRLMVAQSGRIPLSLLSEKSDLGRIDLPIVRLGETITMQVNGMNANSELGAVIWGYARGKSRTLPEGAEILYERWEPFDSLVVAAASTATFNLQPQRNIIMRRIGFDDTVSNFANLYVTFINVQDDPQYTQNVEIPAQLFSELAQDDWLDFDTCQLGGIISIGLRNSNTSQNVTAQGMAVSDIVQLPSDVRRN